MTDSVKRSSNGWARIPSHPRHQKLALGEETTIGANRQDSTGLLWVDVKYGGGYACLVLGPSARLLVTGYGSSQDRAYDDARERMNSALLGTNLVV